MKIRWRPPWQARRRQRSQLPPLLVSPLGDSILRTYEADELADAPGVVRAALDALASAIARVPLRVHRVARGEVREPLLDHPLSIALSQRPNPLEDAWQFGYRIALQSQLSAKGVFILRVGEWERLYLLDPRKVEPRIERGELRSLRVGSEEVDPQQIVWLRKPHPYKPDAAFAPGPALGKIVQMTAEAQGFVLRWVRGDGGLRGLVHLQDHLDPAEEEYLRERLQPGGDRTGGVELVSGTSAGWVDLSGSPRDLSYQQLWQRAVDEILLTLRTPKSIVGDASGRTFANAAVELLTWWEWVVEPEVSRLAAGWSAYLPPDEAVVPDFSGVDAVRAASEERAQQLATLVNAGILSIEEARERLGIAPSSSGGGRTRARTHAKTTQKFGGARRDLVERARLRRSRRVLEQEARVGEVVREWLREREAEIVAALERKDAKRRQSEQEAFEQALGRLVAEAPALGEALRQALVQVAIETRDDVASTLNLSLRGPVPSSVLDALKARVVPLIDPTSPRTPLPVRLAEEIRETVAAALEEGWGVPKMTAAIRERFDFYQRFEAERIARTEVGAARSTAQVGVIRETKEIRWKTWLALLDDRTRETHEALDGTRIPADELFTVGDAQAEAPGLSGVPEEDINCRCELLLETEEMGLEGALESELGE